MYNKLTEITEWKGQANNFIYYTTERNTMLHGYQKVEGGEFIPFLSYKFSTRGRKFNSKKVKVLPNGIL